MKRVVHRSVPVLCTTFGRQSLLRKSRISTSTSRQILTTEDCRGLDNGLDNALDNGLDNSLKGLPMNCPGCGAFSQTHEPGVPGYFTTTRKSLRTSSSRHGAGKSAATAPLEVRLCKDSFTLAEASLIEDLGLEQNAFDNDSSAIRGHFFCDRCHSLLHHQTAGPILNPSIESVKDMISQSPHLHNHVYHVVDAADFPLSVVSGLQRALTLSPQRSRNRRSKINRFVQGRTAALSFVITRSDLFSSNKACVDSMMPYLRQLIRRAMGPDQEHFRLGNIHCVSSKRGWWTRDLREDIWKRGAGGWLVGKINVGKSSLYEAVFPKGKAGESQDKSGTLHGKGKTVVVAPSSFPPAPTEVSYPPMPVVSHLPGTTAAPIRNIYGNNRGELIDLPGLPRAGLHDFVHEKDKSALLLRFRPREKQHNVKPGQSAVISNLIRITPRTGMSTLQIFPFTPLPCHVMDTDKARAVLAQKVPARRGDLATPGTEDVIASAGTFPLRWDSTKERAGPLTRRNGIGLDPRTLPFAILSCDILLEGVGWVELAYQVRRRDMECDWANSDRLPAVEVFSPFGRHVGQRKPLISFRQTQEKDLIW